LDAAGLIFTGRGITEMAPSVWITVWTAFKFERKRERESASRKYIRCNGILFADYFMQKKKKKKKKI